MSANPAPSKQQPPPRVFTGADARSHNKHHQQVQHIINRMLQLLEVPNKAARTINGIHGALNGVDKAKFPVYKSHQWVALQMDFRGKADSSDVFMSRALTALNNAEIKCGHSFFKITRADGVTQKITAYDADYLSDAAEWALVQVRNSPDYFKNPARAVTDQILWDAINKFLPERKPEPTDDGDGSGPSITDDSVIKAQWTRLYDAIEKNLVREMESGSDPALRARIVADKIKDIGRKVKDRYEREHLRAFSSMGDVDEDDADVESEGSGKYTSDSFLPPTPNDAPDEATPSPQTEREEFIAWLSFYDKKSTPPLPTDGVDFNAPPPVVDDPSQSPPQTEGVNCEKPQENSTSETLLPPQTDGVDFNDLPSIEDEPSQSPSQPDWEDDYGWSSIEDEPSQSPPQTDGMNCEKPQENESFSPDTPPDMLEWALFWADNGVPVFPLHSVNPEGLCRCRDGAQCKSPGKHPKTFRGLKEATTDKSQIEKWWRNDPQANIGGATGGAVRLLVVDSDPRHGGDASLHDLVEAHGPEWLDTLTHKTGAGGHHFCYTYPADVDLRNTANKLAPGIDTRAEGGYVVLPPSLHASLKRYDLANTLQTLPAPDWLIEELTRTPEQPPAQVIDFQERRVRASSGGSIIADGERNVRLFKVGCALWGKGEVAGRSELYTQLLAVNLERVSPPLDPSEVVKITDSISGRYPLGVPIQDGGAP